MLILVSNFNFFGISYVGRAVILQRLIVCNEILYR